MPVDSQQVQALMKRCQVGVGGRKALDEAHDIMAECYGTLGALQHEVERLRALAAEVAGIADTGLLPDGDAVTINVRLWADGWTQETAMEKQKCLISTCQ